jgi:hypothetical protein
MARREFAFQTCFAALHIWFVALGILAALHHCRRGWRAWTGKPLSPGF